VADEAVARQLMLRRGVHALLVPPAELDAAAAGEGGPSGAKLRAMALRMVKELGVAKKGDRVVVVQGQGAVPSIAVTLAQVH
jgi:pyruvate kinase